MADGNPSTSASIVKRFKAQPLERRLAEARRIRAKFPGRVPVICEAAPGCTLPDIDKAKYLVPEELTVGQFMFVIRKRMVLPPTVAMFLFTNGRLAPTNGLMSQLYARHKSDDEFLYVVYDGEHTFGNLFPC